MLGLQRSQLSSATAKAPAEPVITPARPFEVIYLDHKGPLLRSGRYTSILVVVVCALTRFTLYIPGFETTVLVEMHRARGDAYKG